MAVVENRSAACQILALMPIFVTLFLTGVTLGWMPIALYHLESPGSDVWLSPEQGSWLASFQQFGRLLITIPTGIILDIVGRRTVSIVCGAFYFIGWLLACSIFTVEAVFVSNFLTGVAIGIANTSCQMYTAELSSADLRGIFHAINSFCYNLGYVFISVLGILLPYKTITVITFFSTFLYFLPAYWMIESPYYLLTRGKNRSAKKSLQRLRDGVSYDEIEEEFEKIKRSTDAQKEFKGNLYAHALTDPTNRKCVLMVLFLNSVAMFTGFLTIRLHSPFLLPVTPLVTSTVQYPLIISCIQLISSVASPFLIEKFDRRKLYISSSIIMAVTLAATGVLFYLNKKIGLVIPYVDTILLVSILFYYVVYATIMLTLLFLAKGELLPQSIRATGSSLNALAQSASSFLSIVLFQLVKDAIGVYFNFGLFSVCCATIAVVVYFYLPETRGKTLAEIQDSLKQDELAGKVKLEYRE